MVCKVQGWAAGIGFQLALAADLTIAADDARFWEPFTERGFTPDSGATWLLPRRVGEVRARELLLLGRALSGRRGGRVGCDPPRGAGRPSSTRDGRRGGRAARARAHRRARADEVAAAARARGAELDAQLANEAFALELSSRTEDFREGIAAFREKRAPRFEGR